MDASDSAAPAKSLVAPSRFLWIVLPYATCITFTTNGPLSWLLRTSGMSVGDVANAIALLGIPSSIYFLWSPLADLWMPRRAWYVLSTVAAGAALVGGAVMLGYDSQAAVWAFFGAMIFCMLISSSYGGLMASMLAPVNRTRAAAWAQASNLGGGAILSSLILLVAQHSAGSIWGIVAALVMIGPAVSVMGGFLVHWRQVGAELRETCLTPKNFFGLLLLIAPPGAGALIGLLPAIAQDYGVAGFDVVWINGLGGGLLMAAGCMAGGWVPRFDRRIAYALAGALNAFPAFFLVFAPPSYNVYMIGTVVYLFTIGLTSTLSMDLVLDVVGAAGRSGSMRYSILTAMSYIPIAYMTWLEGLAANSYGFHGVPFVEALSSLFDLPLILVWVLWRRKLAREARVSS
jgi:PAT family beta-lactamase induction signal transducer AmpG